MILELQCHYLLTSVFAIFSRQHAKYFSDIFFKILGYLKNTWTNFSLICTYLNAFLMLKPNMVMKIWIEKKMKCCLLLTPTWRVKYTRHGSYSFFVLLKFDVFPPPQFQRLVTRTADPIPVISVLIWMHFSYGI